VILRDLLLLLAAGVGAGLINSMAGGGTLLSFPALVLLGRDPIVANATNAVALCPGSLASAFGFRRELAATPHLRRPLLLPSLLGGVLGAWLLLATPGRIFSALVPYLILAATVLIAAKRPLLSLRRRPDAAAISTTSVTAAATVKPRFPWGVAAGQFLVAIYGGYFGAGMGIMMLAIFGLVGLGDIHQRNAWKNLAATVINAVAAVVFIARGAVNWGDAVVLAAGAILGGFVGASLGRRLSPRLAETLVVLIGLGAAVLHFVR
jgi:uncharacterized membrane protein YfcA